MILGWLGSLGGRQRTWSNAEIVEISSYLMKCNDTLPFEIHRKIRPLDNISYWKGTEFRTFGLYLGIVVLKNHIVQSEYRMFLDLFCAVTICSTNFYALYLPLARKLFIDVINAHIEIFGESSITMNIHSLSHIVDDVEHFGPLYTISAYEFENCLHHLKLNLQQCNRPLEQIARRIGERSVSKSIQTALNPNYSLPELSHQSISNDHPGIIIFQCVKYKPGAMLSSVNENVKDKWFLTFENIIVEFHFITRDQTQKKHLIWGSPLKMSENFFNKPIHSSILNVFLSDCEKCESRFFF